MRQFIELSQWIITYTFLFELLLIFKRINNQVNCHLYIFVVSMLVSAYGYLLHLFSITENSLYLTLLFTWAGRIFAVVCSWRFIHSVCGYRIPNPFRSLDFLIGCSAFFILTTTKRTGLFFKNMKMVTEYDMNLLSYDKGSFYYIWDLIVLFAVFAMLVRLLLTIRSTRDNNKKNQLRLLVCGTICNILTAPLTTLPIGRYFDFNQVGFFIASIVMVVSMLKYNLGEVEQSTKDYMIDELSSGVIALEKDGKAAYYNKVAHTVFPELATDVGTVAWNINDAVQTGEIITFQEKVFTPEKKILENGEKLFILNDSTIQYQHINELEEQKQIAENANKAKSEFLASMSHEIRTPINTVLGMDEMILRESEDDVIKEYASDIKDAGQTLLSIINGILDLSKIESGKMELITVPYDSASLINDIVNMIHFRAKEKELDFEIHVSPDIPSKMIGDDVRIRQILMNLLSNAVKYTRRGSVRLSVDVDTDNEQKKNGLVTLHFEVEDTGLGVKSEDLKRLFDDFERLDIINNRNIEGTGLGLPITKRLLEMMGSELHVESEYGKGSLFSFDLSQKVGDETPIGDFKEIVKNSLSGKFGFEKSFIAPDAKILVVDDNDMNRRVFVSLLKYTRMNIHEAGEGQSAVDLASKERFDIIFMDHMMPGMDGVEAMKQIKANRNGPCANTPIVVLTANAIVGAKEKYLEEGFNGFLTKPIEFEKLEKTVRKFLPEKKIKQYSPDMTPVERKKESAVDTDELPVIFGLDWKVALMRLKDKEIMDAVLVDFEMAIDNQAKKLQDFKNGLPETFGDYRILVHAMKSASGSVGIIPLSGMAAILEKAAAEEDADTIDQLHDVFIREWKSYKDGLREYLKTDDASDDDKEEIPVEILKTLLDMLGTAMDDMDIAGADDATDKLSKFKLPQRVAKEFEALQQAVSQLDRDEALEIIKKLQI